MESDNVKLVPINESFRSELINAAADGELWNLWYTSVPSEETIDSYLAQAIEDMQSGLALAFAVIDKKSDKVVGATRFCHAAPKHRRVEIGYTWYSKSVQRSFINTECKQLLLTHAFESLNAIAVEFRTHWHNHASRNAIARLGAKQDGVLRSHMIDAEGLLRDTVVFSIIANEWLTVKKSLEFKINKY